MQEKVLVPGTEWIYITKSGRSYAKTDNGFYEKSQAVSNRGYSRIAFKRYGVQKYFLTHRIVAEVFVHNPHPRKYKIVNHIDSNRLNNDSSNLEWCDQKHNMQHASKTGRLKNNGAKKKPLVGATYDSIRKEFTGHHGNRVELMRKYGVTANTLIKMFGKYDSSNNNGLTDFQVRAIRSEYAGKRGDIQRISSKYGVSRYVLKIILDKT